MIFGIKLESIKGMHEVIHAGCQTTIKLIPHREEVFISENLDFGHFSNLCITSFPSSLEFFSYLCNKLLHPGWSDLPMLKLCHIKVWKLAG